ncbi:MAG: thiamine pyrophosphate-dependent dehydrogenase E1 component subunit alpha [Acidobacteriota bacterium]
MQADVLKRLYAQMLRIRRVEEKIAELYPQQEIRCPVHLCIGQEAIAAGVCDNLSARDYVLSGHRSHGHYLAKGGSLDAMMAELYGKVTGCCQGKGGSMHLSDPSAGFLGSAPIVGSTIPIAVGTALASKMRGEDRVTAVFFGEGATEEGVFSESINFAVLKSLPVLFVCENNFYSVYSPLTVRQPPGRELHRLVRGYGLESFRGDGNNVVRVHGLAAGAVRRARGGEGPTFLELKTYRWREHCGPDYDHHLGYRSQEEFMQWKRNCPLARARKRLLARRVLSREEMDSMVARVDEEIRRAVCFAQQSPFPAKERLLEHVYAR